MAGAANLRLEGVQKSIKIESGKNKKTRKHRWSKHMTNLGFGLIVGGQKSSKMMICWEHERHEKNMAGAANLRLEGVQKSIKIMSNNNKKKKTIQTPGKTPTKSGQGPHGHH